MSTTPATSATAPVAASGSSATTPAGPAGMLGQNDFLKLMIAQLQSQDPLQPANTNEYVSELAQFTQVEQITNLASATELTGAVQLIGRTVTYTDGSGGATTGKVESVQSNASGTTVTVEGHPGVKLQSITEVQ
jgi:flagellar basal-body rod modification protein FlgD